MLLLHLKSIFSLFTSHEDGLVKTKAEEDDPLALSEPEQEEQQLEIIKNASQNQSIIINHHRMEGPLEDLLSR